MIPVPSFANKRVAVMGLGVAGLATARALAASGADVLAWDDAEAGRTAAAAAGIAATDLGAVDWTADLPLVLSPGIPDVFPAPHPVAAAARAAKAEILCDIELLARSVPSATCVTVTGTNGIIIPPDGYLQGLRTLCDKYGILLIADEVMSGFGRTGAWFAVDHWDVVPDIMTVAKGLTSAYLPLGAIMVNDEIAAHFEDNFLYSGLTYGAHPVSCAAAVATIKVYQEDGLIEHAKKMGTVLAHEMERLRKKHPSVGETRSIGLFGLFELVKNRQTREPMAPFNATAAEMGPMTQLGAFFRENGLFTLVRWNTFFVNPPLCISEDQLRAGVAIIDQALDITDAAVSA